MHILIITNVDVDVGQNSTNTNNRASWAHTQPPPFINNNVAATPRHNNPSLPPPAHILSKKVITTSLNTNKEHLSFVIKGRINKETVIKCLLRHHLKRTLCAILAHWSMTVCWRCAGMSLRAPSVGFSSDLLLIPGDWLLKGTAAGGYKPNFWINYSNAVCPKQ